ncbi:MAG: S46 family peptidase [Chlorobi bacterium]|nr:S46 family peptidase [Chlorobiota bacterium]
MKRISIFLAILISLSSLVLRADEGMWIPMLLDRFNIDIMHREGCKLSAEDIYSINQASIKDAVMIFGGGCTAELISGEGLLITNHHCGYRSIQRHSSLGHDYLTDGFWAMSGEEELPNPGLKVTFLKRMEDVTEVVLSHLTPGISEEKRQEIVRQVSDSLAAATIKGTRYTAVVKPFYQGNQYFLFVQEVFEDVRLVGAPPSSIGKFGGDTDNWMWPRHTGDFSLFRIYAGENNIPAPYNPANKPYHPAKFLPVSLKGIHPGDFTIVMGYPGSTSEYVPSYHLKMLVEDLYPKLIAVRDKKLEILNAAAANDPAIRIKYAAKNASISNSWKRWKGEINGLNKLDAIGKKQKYEENILIWLYNHPEMQDKYGTLLARYKKLYPQYGQYLLARNMVIEVFFRYGAEVVGFARQFRTLENMASGAENASQTGKVIIRLKQALRRFYRDYSPAVDEQLFKVLLKTYEDNLDPAFYPPLLTMIRSKYHGNYGSYIHKIYRKTMFADSVKVIAFLNGFKGEQSIKKMKKDPVYQWVMSVDDIYSGKIVPEFEKMSKEKARLDRLYMQLQMTYDTSKVFYPDANFTMRVTYGKVKGYEPRDAVWYKYYTTLKGVIEKDNPQIYDYNVPEKLKVLYENKDYGRYAENGELHVCFIATNHTTGGNSGSPVLDAEGNLVGINFDRAWEGVMSDLMFNPGQCRNISLDIRYALFLIDKYAGAGYLLDEMNIVE